MAIIIDYVYTCIIYMYIHVCSGGNISICYHLLLRLTFSDFKGHGSLCMHVCGSKVYGDVVIPWKLTLVKSYADLISADSKTL